MRETIRNAAASFALAFLLSASRRQRTRKGCRRSCQTGRPRSSSPTTTSCSFRWRKKALKWEEPTEPVQIAGPLYFVGTKGLGVFLFTTSEGTS